MLARRTRVKIVYQGIDITTSLEPYLTEFTYTDNEGRADDIQITLQDRDKKWQGPWLPGKGDTIKATIETYNKKREGDFNALNCGTFYVDEVDFSGPPDTIKIKALSIPLAAGGKNAKRSRVWQAVTFSSIASDIAEGSGLKLLFDAPNPYFDRVDQIQKTDLSFFSSLAKKEGISVKVNDEQLIVYDEQSYETKSSVRDIIRNTSDVISFSFKIATADNEYKDAEISYFDASKKKVLKYIYTVPGVEKGPRLKINERVKSLNEAIRRAKKAVRNKNKYNQTGRITVAGDTGLVQGLTIDAKNFGRYDAKYFVESSVHKVTGGYTTDITIRKVLGY